MLKPHAKTKGHQLPTSPAAEHRNLQKDHAFPMLDDQGSEFPPNFRFMWVSR